MILHNLAHAAIMNGYSCRFTTASAMLNHLASEEGAHGLQTALRRYSSPQVLVIDEVGYLSYGNRHADLLFEVISRRYGQKSTLVSTNKPFAQWNEVFPNAACVVTLVDRLIHHSDRNPGPILIPTTPLRENRGSQISILKRALSAIFST
jgi:DNA replication protein DnaC